MRSQRNSQFSAAIGLIFAFALAVFLLSSAYQKQHWDSDIFWALKSGEWILSNLKVPDSDPFSYTFQGRPWIDFTWGFQVLAYISYANLGGWTGLFLLQAVTTGLTFAFIYFNIRNYSRSGIFAVFLLFLAFISSHTRLYIRPHLFEYFFVSLYLLILNSSEKDGKERLLWLLPPLQILWVNIHSSAILGVFLALAYAAGDIIDEARSHGLKALRAGKGRIGPKLVSAVIVPLASLVNPYGLKLAIFPLVHQSPDNMDAIRHIGEWTKPKLDELFLYLYPFPVDHFAFVVITALAVASVAIALKSGRTRDLFVLALGIYLAVSHARWVPLFAYFALPVIAANLSGLYEKGKAAFWLKAGAFAACAFFAGVFAYDLSTVKSRANLGLGLKGGVFPEATVNFMKREGIRGKIYNEYVYGGYLIFSYPEQKVFIDGRTPTVYSPYFFWTSRLAQTDQSAWDKLVSEHGINVALVKSDTPFCASLRGNASWQAVTFDDTAVLFLRADEFAAHVDRFGLKHVNPCAQAARFELPEDREGLLLARVELKKVISTEIEGTSGRAQRLLGLTDTALGPEYWHEGLDALEKAISVNEDAYTLYDYGTLLGRLKRPAEALRAFEKAVALDSNFKDGYLGAGLASHDLKEYAKALKYLKRYVTSADDKAEPLGIKTLGLSYFKVSEFEDAHVWLKRAAFLAAEPTEKADIDYEIGNVLAELGSLQEAAAHYRKALKGRPAYRTVLEELAASHERNGRKDLASAVLGALN